MGTRSPGRSACSGPAPHTHTQARHTHTHTHTLTSHNQFLQVYSYTTALTLERDIAGEKSELQAKIADLADLADLAGLAEGGAGEECGALVEQKRTFDPKTTPKLLRGCPALA